ILVIDGENGTIIDANMAAATVLGAKRAKLNGDPIVNCFIRTDRAAITNAVNQSRHSGSLKTVSTQLAVNEAQINVTLEPYRENGRTNLLVTLHQTDNTKPDYAKGGDHALVLDSFPEALVTIDLKGNIVEVNDQFLDLVHVLNKSSLQGRNLNNWLGVSNVDMQVLLTRLRDERQIRQFGSVVRDELGEQVPVLVSASRYGEGQDARIGIFISDTPRRESNLTVPTPGSNGESSDFAELVGRVPLKELIREASDVIEKMCIEAALRQTENNRASAADMLGLSRQSLYIKLKRHSLENYDGTSQS
ncbi:MAG: PAS domain S-box protein, partial [Ahrensia sp.]